MFRLLVPSVKVSFAATLRTASNSHQSRSSSPVSNLDWMKRRKEQHQQQHSKRRQRSGRKSSSPSTISPPSSIRGGWDLSGDNKAVNALFGVNQQPDERQTIPLPQGKRKQREDGGAAGKIRLPENVRESLMNRQGTTTSEEFTRPRMRRDEKLQRRVERLVEKKTVTQRAQGLHPCLVQHPTGECPRLAAGFPSCPYENLPADLCLSMLKFGRCSVHEKNPGACKWKHNVGGDFDGPTTERVRGSNRRSGVIGSSVPENQGREKPNTNAYKPLAITPFEIVEACRHLAASSSSTSTTIDKFGTYHLALEKVVDVLVYQLRENGRLQMVMKDSAVAVHHRTEGGERTEEDDLLDQWVVGIPKQQQSMDKQGEQTTPSSPLLPSLISAGSRSGKAEAIPESALPDDIASLLQDTSAEANPQQEVVEGGVEEEESASSVSEKKENSPVDDLTTFHCSSQVEKEDDEEVPPEVKKVIHWEVSEFSSRFPSLLHHVDQRHSKNPATGNDDSSSSGTVVQVHQSLLLLVDNESHTSSLRPEVSSSSSTAKDSRWLGGAATHLAEEQIKEVARLYQVLWSTVFGNVLSAVSSTRSIQRGISIPFSLQFQLMLDLYGRDSASSPFLIEHEAYLLGSTNPSSRSGSLVEVSHLLIDQLRLLVFGGAKHDPWGYLESAPQLVNLIEDVCQRLGEVSATDAVATAVHNDRKQGKLERRLRATAMLISSRAQNFFLNLLIQRTGSLVVEEGMFPNFPENYLSDMTMPPSRVFNTRLNDIQNYLERPPNCKGAVTAPKSIGKGLLMANKAQTLATNSLGQIFYKIDSEIKEMLSAGSIPPDVFHELREYPACVSPRSTTSIMKTLNRLLILQKEDLSVMNSSNKKKGPSKLFWTQRFVDHLLKIQGSTIAMKKYWLPTKEQLAEAKNTQRKKVQAHLAFLKKRMELKGMGGRGRGRNDDGSLESKSKDARALKEDTSHLEEGEEDEGKMTSGSEDELAQLSLVDRQKLQYRLSCDLAVLQDEESTAAVLEGFFLCRLYNEGLPRQLQLSYCFPGDVVRERRDPLLGCYGSVFTPVESVSGAGGLDEHLHLRHSVEKEHMLKWAATEWSSLEMGSKKDFSSVCKITPDLLFADAKGAGEIDIFSMTSRQLMNFLLTNQDELESNRMLSASDRIGGGKGESSSSSSTAKREDIVTKRAIKKDGLIPIARVGPGLQSTLAMLKMRPSFDDILQSVFLSPNTFPVFAAAPSYKWAELFVALGSAVQRELGSAIKILQMLGGVDSTLSSSSRREVKSLQSKVATISMILTHLGAFNSNTMLNQSRWTRQQLATQRKEALASALQRTENVANSTTPTRLAGPHSSVASSSDDVALKEFADPIFLTQREEFEKEVGKGEADRRRSLLPVGGRPAGRRSQKNACVEIECKLGFVRGLFEAGVREVVDDEIDLSRGENTSTLHFLDRLVERSMSLLEQQEITHSQFFALSDSFFSTWISIVNLLAGGGGLKLNTSPSHLGAPFRGLDLRSIHLSFLQSQATTPTRSEGGVDSKTKKGQEEIGIRRLVISMLRARRPEVLLELLRYLKPSPENREIMHLVLIGPDKRKKVDDGSEAVSMPYRFLFVDEEDGEPEESGSKEKQSSPGDILPPVLLCEGGKWNHPSLSEEWNKFVLLC